MPIKGTTGALIDMALEARTKRLALQLKVDALKAKQHELELELMKRLNKSKLASASGKRATFSIRPARVPTVVDWSKVEKFVTKNDAFDLYQKRMNEGAWRERLDAGILVSGTKAETITKTSLTAKRK